MAIMSMGKVAIVNIARKHKMNVVSSTESEQRSIADHIGPMADFQTHSQKIDDLDRVNC